MNSIGWGFLLLAVAVTFGWCLKLEQRTERLRTALTVGRGQWLAREPSERLLGYNEWVDEAMWLREQAVLVPRALGRVCLLSGAGLAVIQVARSLASTAPAAGATAAGLSVSAGVTGLAVTFFFGGRLRTKNAEISERMRVLRAALVTPGGRAGSGRAP